jgi:hypothetical protein
MKPGRHWRIRPIDVLLLPVALLVVLIEDVLWRAARAGLRRAEALSPVRRARGWVAGLPAAAVLPLFLVPEAISHLAGLDATLLLAQGHVRAAVLLAVLVKGGATLVEVWIYESASATLLTVGWFARLHAAVMAMRGWALGKVAPMRQAVLNRLRRSTTLGVAMRRRIRLLRPVLASIMGVVRPPR